MTHQPIDDNAGEYRWPLPTVKHPDPSIADRPAYIARCRACRGMIGCCATDGILVDVADFVAECIKDGATIHYGTAANVWAAMWCTCQNDDEQPMLFSDERRVAA